jgi:hypothetical protein
MAVITRAMLFLRALHTCRGWAALLGYAGCRGSSGRGVHAATRSLQMLPEVLGARGWRCCEYSMAMATAHNSPPKMPTQPALPEDQSAVAVVMPGPLSGSASVRISISRVAALEPSRFDDGDGPRPSEVVVRTRYANPRCRGSCFRPGQFTATLRIALRANGS